MQGPGTGSRYNRDIMIIVIVHHWCKPDTVDAALRRVDENGDSSAAAPGFLFRYRLHRPEEPLRLSTVNA